MFDLLKWLEDAPLKLTYGVGHPETGGCWMAALSVYSGVSWSDHPPCVCPIIRVLCISLNDKLSSDEARGRIIGPHILAPVGTATTDPAVVEARRWHLVDAAVRRFAPHALRLAGLADEADTLESLPAVTEDNREAAARAAARAAAYAAAYAAARAAADAARAAAYAAAYAAYAADEAADEAAYEAQDEFCETALLPVILDLCAIGDVAPHEPSCDELSFRRAVQCV